MKSTSSRVHLATALIISAILSFWLIAGARLADEMLVGKFHRREKIVLAVIE